MRMRDEPEEFISRATRGIFLPNHGNGELKYAQFLGTLPCFGLGLRSVFAYGQPVSTPVYILSCLSHCFDLGVFLGCGDGRVILQWASAYSSLDHRENSEATVPSFVGIDIDADRIKVAEKALEQARSEGRIDPRISISFNCANALETTDLYRTATVFFLYLIPRGLRKIKPYLLQTHQDGDITAPNGLTDQPSKQVRVVTYMSKFPDETPARSESISVPHQPGASWPLHLYKFPQSAGEVEST
jgi:hypothetical protein